MVPMITATGSQLSSVPQLSSENEPLEMLRTYILDVVPV